jgi:hypothetical protein
MPFESAKQELWMRKKQPEIWRKWVKRYGHHPGYSAAVKRSAKKAAKTRKRKGRR